MITWQQLISSNSYKNVKNENELEAKWLKAVDGIKAKIIVLDDDPTGVQTVHSLPVYTSWEAETLRQIMVSDDKVVYILTNSRALPNEKTKELHQYIGQMLVKLAGEYKQEFILISRNDSTLRGHYPVETKTLYQELIKIHPVDGEIIIPFFEEGGRYTYQDIHYVKEGDNLIPAGETEFAQDSTFGYQSSNLKEWVEEKYDNKINKDTILSISLSLLREENYQKIKEILLAAQDFSKIIVNALNYNDLKVFVIALAEVMTTGKYFLFRTAASFVRVIGGIRARPLLTGPELRASSRNNPGLIIVGSYVNKTTRQLERLNGLLGLSFIEWRVKEAMTLDGLEAEANRVNREVKKALQSGSDVCVYTSRDYVSIDQEDKLAFSVRISQALVRVVKELTERPGFIIAKGGITSSDIGVKALEVKKAEVLGQILPGIPVWKLGAESKFPGLSYIIFPGNVGEADSLKEAVVKLRAGSPG